MLITMKAILELAEVKNIAIGAFNITSLEGIQAVLEASEELNQPVILQFAPVHEAIIPMKVIGPIMLMMAERASVPVAVHLDHGDDLSILKKALDMGFTSVMYDGSACPLRRMQPTHGSQSRWQGHTGHLWKRKSAPWEDRNSPV